MLTHDLESDREERILLYQGWATELLWTWVIIQQSSSSQVQQSVKFSQLKTQHTPSAPHTGIVTVKSHCCHVQVALNGLPQCPHKEPLCTEG